MKRLLAIVTVAAIIFSLYIPVSAQDTEKKGKKFGYDFEKVEVVNVQVPVRVFRKKKPVTGLTKKDFIITENGKIKDINGFYMVRKKLPVVSPQTSGPDQAVQMDVQAPEPRFFLLLFNITDSQIDFREGLDTLFKSVLRPGDHLMAITNGFVLNERKIKDLEVEKNNILKLVTKDAARISAARASAEVDLRVMANELDRRLKDRIKDPIEIIFGDFFRDYTMKLDELKWEYFGLAADQYVRIAQYLKTRKMEKYVLSFQQRGFFPQPTGDLKRNIDYYMEKSSRIRTMALEFYLKIGDVDSNMGDSVGKLFLNTGATFHTLLMKPRVGALMKDYRYDIISTDSENILSSIARKTGGSMMRSLKIENFVRDIKEREDIYYVLTYVPEVSQRGKKQSKRSQIRVKLASGKGHRLVYDNQDAASDIDYLVRKATRHLTNLKIRRMVVSNGLLSTMLSGIQVVSQDGKKVGTVEARIMILDIDSNVVFDQRKFYKSHKDIGLLQVKIPYLKEGQYNVVVEAKDLQSWKSDVSGEMITI